MRVARSNCPSKRSRSMDCTRPSWRLALLAEHSLGLWESITRRYDELTRSLDEQLGLGPRLVYRQLLGQT